MINKIFKLSVLIAFVSLSIVPSRSASALTFNPNNLMDNAIFDKVSSLNETQIDSFLNTFPSSCISTNNSFSSPDVIGYNPGAGFVYGGNVSAGKVIGHAAEVYGINPEVLLATLQKEQSLVTGSAGCYSEPDPSWPLAGLPTSNSTFYWASRCSQTGAATSTLCTKACTHNGGCMNIAVGYDCPYYCRTSSEGFSKQIIKATWSLKFHEQRSIGNVNWNVQKTTTIDASGNPWVSAWDNSDDPPTRYSSFMTQGTFSLYQGGPAVPFDGYGTVTDLNNSPVSLHIDTGPTAALYAYTPFESGNQSFYYTFTNWFTSTSSLPVNCDSKVDSIICVWTAIKLDGSEFLTASRTELDSAMSKYGWIYGGINFYASLTQLDGTVPVHRFNQNNSHFYTADQTEYDTMKASANWTDEGIVFYAYPSTVSISASHVIYRLYNSSNSQHYWTADENQKALLLNSGYVLEQSNFNGFSGLIKLPLVTSDRSNIYRLRENIGYFYTTSLAELESVVIGGYQYFGVLTTANAAGSGTAVYRLRNGSRHFYTANISEKDIAISKYGFVYEGIGFYVDSSSSPIYRLANSRSNSYLYSSSIDEIMSTNNTNGWGYDGVLVDKSTNSTAVYRFINLQSNKHFYTIDINEAMQITNKSWLYETIAFYANKSSGLPVYRLLKYDKHFYTTDVYEKNIAVSKYGYVDEGVAFYVSQSTTSMPVYRLQGGSDEYFYTASSSEKDTAISKYSYRYEGQGFYLSTN